MTYEWPGTEAEKKIARLLVAQTGGHFVSLVSTGPDGRSERLGVKAGKGAVDIKALLEAALSTDAEPVLYISRSGSSCSPEFYKSLVDSSRKNWQPLYAHPALSAQVRDVAGWQDMDSAPADGSSMLLRLSNGEVFSGWGAIEKDGSKTWRRFHATSADVGWLNARHWMPLPAAPDSKQEA